MEQTVYWIDLFCGAGGTTLGISQSSANSKVIACVNHYKNAILSHKANHSEALHLTEDIRDKKVVKVLYELVSKLRKENPKCLIAIWASLECTNFSNAKGGLPRDADSRTLAEHLFMYLEMIDPDYLYIENVREFMQWGPMRQQTKISNKKILWRAHNPKGKPKTVWMEVPFDNNEELYRNCGLQSWDKPIPEKKGVHYFRWINKVKSYGYNHDHKLLNAAEFGEFTHRTRYFGIFAKPGLPIAFPQPTHTAKQIKGKLFDDLLLPFKAVKDVLDLHIIGNSIFGLTQKGIPYSDRSLERVFEGLQKQYGVFLTSYYGNGGAHSIEVPCNTLTTKDRFALHHIHYDYSTPTHSNILEPSGAITTNPKHNLVSWLFDFQYKNTGRDLDRPGPTLIARMDKKPVYLATAIIGNITDQRQDQPDDTPIRKKIRAFMREHGIMDVTIRGLSIPELKRIQGFPEDYVLIGTKAEQKKFIGNSVNPKTAKMLDEALGTSLQNLLIQQSA